MLRSPKRISGSVASGDGTETKHTPRWHTHSYNRPVFYRLVAISSPCIPRSVRFGLARVVALVFCRLLRREYAVARGNLLQILPHADAATIERMTQSLFRNFAYFFTDLLSLNHLTLSRQQRYVHGICGEEHLRAALATPRGFLVATAHVGNWDLAGRLLSTYGRTIHVLVAPEQEAAIQRLLRERDCPPNLRFVAYGVAGEFVQLLMALRRGDVVAFQADRGTGHRRDVPVTFFGAPALFPYGPFALAAAAQVPILPCFCLMRPDRHYDIFVDEAIRVVRGQETHALQHMVRVLERYVAMAPDQWFNFYDVWHQPSVT
jgi:Kdo2-lipid IVA lauroyltransferase/acyltransferase